jgi:hypothetical protein
MQYISNISTGDIYIYTYTSYYVPDLHFVVCSIVNSICICDISTGHIHIYIHIQFIIYILPDLHFVVCSIVVGQNRHCISNIICMHYYIYALCTRSPFCSMFYSRWSCPFRTGGST